MTLCVGITTSDGLILAADSMTELHDPLTSSSKFYPNAEKIFELPNLSMAAMTYGLGAVGRQSIGNLIDEWTEKRPVFEKSGSYAVSDVAASLAEFIFSRHRKFRENMKADIEQRQREALSNPNVAASDLEYNDTDWTTGLIVGGYQPESYFPWLYAIEEPARKDIPVGLTCVRNHEGDAGMDGPEPGIDYWGEAAALDRVYRGCDPSLLLDMAALMPPDAVNKLEAMLRRHRWGVLFDGMPLKDAADLAKFMLDVGCNFGRFSEGSPRVGGDAEVVVVTRTRTYWPYRKPIGAALAAVQPRVLASPANGADTAKGTGST
jgi:hypothetical protein